MIGIDKPKVSSLVQLPTSITAESIRKAIESLGAIEVLVDAPDTKTVPHLPVLAPIIVPGSPPSK